MIVSGSIWGSPIRDFALLVAGRPSRVAARRRRHAQRCDVNGFWTLRKRRRGFQILYV